MPPASHTSESPRFNRLHSGLELLLGGLLLGGLGWLMGPLMASAANWWLAVGLYAVMSALVLLFWPYGALGWANRVTLGRGVLVALVAGALVGGAFQQAIGLWLGVAVIALLLDGVDGWIARRTHSHSPFGARFDMELDALLILLLCLALMRAEALGPWVLLIGAMRYGFVAAGWLLPWLEAPLYDSFRRKLICVWQVTALLLALTPFTSSLYASLLALGALLSLAYSFGVDVWWLYRRRRTTAG